MTAAAGPSDDSRFSVQNGHVIISLGNRTGGVGKPSVLEDK